MESCGDNHAICPMEKALEEHIPQTISESVFLNRCAQTDPHEHVHIIMYFAENVALPSFVHHHGRLRFLTGLKNYLFEIYCCNDNSNYIFSLPKGHWAAHKSVNEVISMLDSFFEHLKMKLREVCQKTYHSKR